jgi:hypothetical protein
VVPATSSAATIVRLFGVVITIPPNAGVAPAGEDAFIKLPFQYVTYALPAYAAAASKGYRALFDALDEADPNSKDVQGILSMFDQLDGICAH